MITVLVYSSRTYSAPPQPRLFLPSPRPTVASPLSTAGTQHHWLVKALAKGIGAGLIGYAIVVGLFTFGPPLSVELQYRFGGQKMRLPPVHFGELIQTAQADRTSQAQAEAASYNVSSYFSVVIPKINAAANIIPNIDAANPSEYDQALLKGVAHAKGTYFPGQGKHIYLFAHSTTDSPAYIRQYNAVFYLLRDLQPGDQILVFFADHKYLYQVARTTIVPPNDTSWITDPGNEEELILQTCDPPGTTWNRLLVIAKPTNAI